MLGDAVGELVGHHVVGGREALPEPHLGPVPVGVREGARVAGLAVPDPGDERQARRIQAVPAETGEVEVVGVAEVGVGEVGVGDPRRRPALAAHERAERAAHVVGVVDGAALRLLDLREVEGDVSDVRVDEHQLVHHRRVAPHADVPDELARPRLPDHRGLEDHELRLVHDEVRRGRRAVHERERHRLGGVLPRGGRRVEVLRVQVRLVARQVGQHELDPTRADLDECGGAEHRDPPELLAQPNHAPVAHRLRTLGHEAHVGLGHAERHRVLREEGSGGVVAAHAPRERKAPARRCRQGPDVPLGRAGEKDHVEAFEAATQGGGRRGGGHGVAQPIDGGLESRVRGRSGGRDAGGRVGWGRRPVGPALGRGAGRGDAQEGEGEHRREGMGHPASGNTRFCHDLTSSGVTPRGGRARAERRQRDARAVMLRYGIVRHSFPGSTQMPEKPPGRLITLRHACNPRTSRRPRLRTPSGRSRMPARRPAGGATPCYDRRVS